jgi:hypothetical protein
MESPTEPLTWSDWARSVEPWVLPAIAAVVVGGALLLCTLIGSFWLASRSSRQPIVIWMTPPNVTSLDQDRPAPIQVAVQPEK